MNLKDRFSEWSRSNPLGKEPGTMSTEQMEHDALNEQPELEATATESAAGELHAELEQLRAERDSLKDRLARLQAEFDNSRKRLSPRATSLSSVPA